ncbi:MAG: hypothetical protein KG003_03985 [Bacteroidetes bacterium]|nr:hypothetical protein [Bacteroidota bacterium]
MKPFFFFIFGFLFAHDAIAQSTLSGTKLIGIWAGDSSIHTLQPGDTIRWYYHGQDTFVPYSVQLYSKGKMREMTVYFWCGNRSWWEIIIFRRDAKYRKGKWYYENCKGEYLNIHERRRKTKRMQIISSTQNSLLLRLI